MTLEGIILAKYIAKVADSKKAKDIIILDLRKTGFISDFFVVMSCMSDTHGKALANSIEEKLKSENIRVNHIEKDTKNTWILLDYFNVIVHIFHEDTRKYYNLERLWGDVKNIKWQEKK